MKKYEFTGETKTLNCGVVVKQIKRIEDGLIGGWIEHEDNLSHDGPCFVYGDACVYNNAHVSGNAHIKGHAHVYGNARVYDNAHVSGSAYISDFARVSGNARVYGDAAICDNACVDENARVNGNARVYGKSKVSNQVQTCITYKHPITMTDSHIAIGCENHTFEYWKENIEKIGKKYDYTDKEIKAIKHILTGLSYLKSENSKR